MDLGRAVCARLGPAGRAARRDPTRWRHARIHRGRLGRTDDIADSRNHHVGSGGGLSVH